MNQGNFIGRVGQDAELRYTANGKAVASFSMALDNGKDSTGEKRPPTWIKATIWEKRAEALAPHITKGKLIAVTGPVSTEAWIDREGTAQTKLVVTVRELELCGGTKTEDAAKPTAESTIDEDIPF